MTTKARSNTETKPREAQARGRPVPDATEYSPTMYDGPRPVLTLRRGYFILGIDLTYGWFTVLEIGAMVLIVAVVWVYLIHQALWSI